jgi:hypothetical protein
MKLIYSHKRTKKLQYNRKEVGLLNKLINLVRINVKKLALQEIRL